MKISNMTSKTSIEISDTDVLLIEDSEDTKQVSVKEFKEYLLNHGITRNTKVLINDMLDNIISSLKTSKYLIAELITHKMNVVISGSGSYDIYIALQNIATEKWLTVDEIRSIQMPNDDGLNMRELVVSIATDTIFAHCSECTIIDASEISAFSPKENMGYIKAHFEGLTQNEIACITYNDIFVTLKDTEIVIELPIEDRHSYEFISDPSMFNNNVPYIQEIG